MPQQRSSDAAPSLIVFNEDSAFNDGSRPHKIEKCDELAVGVRNEATVRGIRAFVHEPMRR